MKFTTLTMAALLTATLSSLLPVKAQLPSLQGSNSDTSGKPSESCLSPCEETSSANTYQPGFWQPEVRANATRPVQIEFINQTGLTLEYALTTNQAPPRQLLPNGSATLSQFPLPANVLINPTHSSGNLKYDVAVAEDNVVTVEIRQVPEEAAGDNALNINQSGAIYIY
ncbi:MAG: hypothetical protein BRC38_10915 [Cyanobacteria bacterium QH_6_48_35]|jgi:hypothetical protein|nr:MAG: hypothetical protein BRC35_02665 [Cyanobacteria bacterium QH_10_48_56]PSO64640.1 MAG: hypothetical protein BRC38_10915 [Cyanobacteria bacterium QH_6_48_35]PSO73569.1 MAG: hypothetical protein BRC37_09190 [Cyanobacteria bacterium QH_3_48_40]PSO81427.1 MAG: hypothetical protein BRC41_15200 [Cyanobacteria bacterium QH_9_48_43]PSO84714.1 MAG: hypothetical protein BRC45_05225 [Cyanobacteria bacterium QS_5_48_63]PSO91921.1 MAG: hypothetical protein BRC48_15185 [Cyanobacteria bacterium QS_9_4